MLGSRLESLAHVVERLCRRVDLAGIVRTGKADELSHVLVDPKGFRRQPDGLIRKSAVCACRRMILSAPGGGE